MNHSMALAFVDNLPDVPNYQEYLMYSGTLNAFLLSYIVSNYLQFS
jgi:hypothetical protein